MATYKDTLLLVDKVTAPLKQIQKNTEKATQVTQKLTKKYNGLQKGLRNAEAGILHLDRKLRDMSSQMEKYSKRTEHIAKLGNKIKSIGQGLTVGVTLPVIAMGGAMVKAAADIEAMQQQLSTMLGSAEKGSKMFDEIKKMAATTPFETKDLMAATNTMLGFGISEKKVLPLMRQLGDISGGNAQRFQSLALAFSQVSSAGKLQGQDLLQMINAGFNPLEAIAKRTGKSVGYWKEMMSKGAVTIAMVEQAMKDATSEGGRFYNMMEKQSRTALGQWSTFQDNLNMLLADFGQIILPYAIKGLQKLSKTLEWFNSLSPNTKKTILVIGGIAAVLGPLATIIGSTITALAGLNTALMWLVANPIALTIITWTAIIAGLAAGIWTVIKAIQTLVGWIQHLNRMKINDINSNFDEGQLQKLSKLQASMGNEAFAAKYGKDVGKTVSNYRNSNITNNTNSNNTTSNTYNTTTNYNSIMPFSQPQYAI